MAYHTLGNSKYDAFGIENKISGKDAMTKEEKRGLYQSYSTGCFKDKQQKYKGVLTRDLIRLIEREKVKNVLPKRD